MQYVNRIIKAVKGMGRVKNAKLFVLSVCVRAIVDEHLFLSSLGPHVARITLVSVWKGITHGQRPTAGPLRPTNSQIIFIDCFCI